MKGDEEYQGRVQYTRTSQNNCSLRICNLRETDARIYTFRFYTDADRYKGEPGVSLSVTDLKVTVSNLGEGFKKLSCITNCTLSDNPTYIWYKNGRRVDNQDIKDLYLYDTKDTGRYSCAVRGHEDLPSPAASVTLWSVKYATLTICAPIGSSVDLYSYSTFPEDHKVTNRFWFVKKQSGGEGVMEDQGRVRYACNSRNNCSMRIRNLTETDARIYTFRLDTDGGDYTGEPGVSLSVTDLTVTVSDRSEQNMTLSCNTTCTLSNDPTYIWYKNGERVSECKSASCSVTAVGGDVSCAVKGHDDVRSPPVYSPKNTRAAVLPSGLPVKGDSVTLSCSSDANPPVLTFSWFKQRSATDTLLTQEQNYSISNISSQDSGLYYCTATNQLGRHNSTPVHLDMTGSLEGLKFSMVGLGVFLAVTLLLGALWLWKRHSSSMNGRSNNDQSGELQSAPVYASILSLNRRGRLVSDDQENVAYSSVVFKPSDTQVGSRSCGFPPDPTDEEVVQYAAVNVHGSAAAAQ